MNKNEYEYNHMMKKVTKDIKKIDDEYMDAQSDMIAKGECSYGAFLWQQKIVSEIKFYITHLGLLDALIVSEEKGMEWDKEFSNIESYKEHKEKYNYYIIQRNKLLKILESSTDIIFQFNFIKNVLESIPASDKFNLLYEDMNSNHYQLKLQLEFINAYNVGFMQEGYVKYAYITRQFEKYYEQIEEHKCDNNAKLAQLKLKYLSK